MKYLKFFEDIGLSKIKDNGTLVVYEGNIPAKDLQLFYFNKTDNRLPNENIIDLVKEAREYCHKLKLANKYKVIVSDKFDQATFETHREYIAQLIPFADTRDSVIHFFDEKTHSVSNTHEDIFMALTGIGTRRELLSIAMSGYCDFNPLRTEPHYTQVENGRVINVLNLCKTPKWFGQKPNPKYDLESSLIYRLILNLFPEEKSREYALCWAYHAITGRNHTYLSLVGARGVGKGMFADLIGQLVGRNYFQKCDDSVLEDKFNSQFENNRVLFFDEVVVDDEEKINRLKSLANNHISVEAKGKDARTIRNYTSCIMANNSMSGMKIGPEERRFSIVTIGKTDLRKVMDETDIEHLVRILETDSEQEPPEEIVNFGHWLLNEYADPTYSNTYTYKEDYFYQVSMNGLAEWKQFIISIMETDSQLFPITVRDLKKKYADHIGADRDKVAFPQPKRIQDFLTEYRYKDNFSLGKVVVAKDGLGKSLKAIEISQEMKDYCAKLNNDFIDL